MYLFSANDASAQMKKGDMAAGLNFGLLMPGIGGKFQYATSDKIRLQADFTRYTNITDEETSVGGGSMGAPEITLIATNRWDSNVNMHYMLSEKKVAPYLVMGIGVVSKGNVLPAFNLGGGLDIGIGDKLALNFEFKIRLIALLQAGIVYRF